MVALEIKVNNTVDKALDALFERAFDLRPALTAAGLYQRRSFAKQFDAEGVPRWQPLSPVTIARRRKGWRRKPTARIPSLAPKILQDTGTLKRSYISKTGEGAIWRLDRRSLTIGSNIEYAGKHQYGQGRIPKRPLRILEEDKQMHEKLIYDYLAGAWK